eukprot:777567_1
MFIPRNVAKRRKSGLGGRTGRKKQKITLTVDAPFPTFPKTSRIGSQSAVLHSTAPQPEEPKPKTPAPSLTPSPVVSNKSEKPESSPEKPQNSDESCDESPIIQASFMQRDAVPGEPICVVCGKFGEYICDKTDQDVCSLECKGSHLRSLGLAAPLPVREKPTKQKASNDYVYEEDASISVLTSTQVAAIRDAFHIQVRGERVPKPIVRFDDAHLASQLSKNLKYLGFDEPTAVQMQCLPPALQRRDILACAPTGSGKTAAFLIPIIETMKAFWDGNYSPNEKPEPLGLILCPTRELAMQIEQQAKNLCYHLDLKTALIVGGVPAPTQVFTER